MRGEPIWGVRRAVTLAAAAVAWLAACAPTDVRPVGSTYSGARLARPDVVLVRDFAVTPGEVQLDRGVSARLISAVDGASASAQEVAVARQVVAAISAALAAEINKLGLPAQTSSAAAEAAWNRRLVVEGQVISIDQGNRTKRTMIGLGAGHSEVEADAQALYETRGTAPRLVESFEAAAKSGRKPGLAEGLGAGMVLDRVVTSAAVSAGAAAASEVTGATVEDDGTRMGKEIARKLASFFAAQGWIPEEAAR
jgi:hypothetical protein